MKYQILQGDNRETLKTLADNSIDAIVTDPPYGIDFLGKSWDANTGALETYQECLRVLKPGGHILAFSAARTYHHLAVTLEQAGFEIRDQIMWIYSSGFPKSQDVGKSIDRSAGKKNNLKRHDSDKKDNNGLDLGSGVRCPECGKDSAARYSCDKGQECGMVYKPQTKEAVQWAGWGTALKPAHEPIALARKPMRGSIKDNVLKHGVGALNIDATRVPYDGSPLGNPNTAQGIRQQKGEFGNGMMPSQPAEWNEGGRFPSNVIGEILQADYQKYFYCPKVSRKERHIGFDDVPDPLANYAQGDVKNHPLWDPSIGTNVQRLKHKIMENNKDLGKKQGAVKTNPEMVEDMGGYFVDENNNKTTPGGNKIWLPQSSYIYAHGLKEEYKKWCEANNKTPNVGNNHPTVKPIALMKYLIKLITPPGGIVLDPFNGSGSTGCAAVELGYEYIGCELDPAYVAITEKRIAAWNKQDTIFEELFE
jgi:site-specific DNA-methyltransferase (adenine-specific)